MKLLFHVDENIGTFYKQGRKNAGNVPQVLLRLWCKALPFLFQVIKKFDIS